MFLGEFRHSLDAKGRLVLPSEMRSELEEGAVITKSNRGMYLVGFPRAGFEALATRISEEASADDDLRLVSDRFFAVARTVTLDRAGRILIPENLRAYAALESDAVITGSVDHFNVWDAAHYDDEALRADSVIPELSRRVRGLNF